MVLLIKKESDNFLFKVIISIIVILIVIAILYLLWRFVAVPISEGRLLGIRVACTQAPAVPTNLSGTVINGSQIQVQWDRTPQTDSYVLYSGATANFSTIAAQRSITTTRNRVTLSNLAPGPHYLKVVAINSCGRSALSNEILVTTTIWPSRFKLCKADNPTLCLLMQSNQAFARLSRDCPNNQCSIEYAGQTSIRNPDRNLCLESDRNTSSASIEVPVTTETCNNGTAWTINPASGRISSSDGMCLGANSQDSSLVFNTQCNLISSDRDTRYNWTVSGL